jgi:hypothetical protein
LSPFSVSVTPTAIACSSVDFPPPLGRIMPRRLAGRHARACSSCSMFDRRLNHRRRRFVCYRQEDKDRPTFLKPGQLANLVDVCLE